MKLGEVIAAAGRRAVRVRREPPQSGHKRRSTNEEDRELGEEPWPVASDTKAQIRPAGPKSERAADFITTTEACRVSNKNMKVKNKGWFKQIFIISALQSIFLSEDLYMD